NSRERSKFDAVRKICAMPLISINHPFVAQTFLKKTFLQKNSRQPAAIRLHRTRHETDVQNGRASRPICASSVGLRPAADRFRGSSSDRGRLCVRTAG